MPRKTTRFARCACRRRVVRSSTETGTCSYRTSRAPSSSSGLRTPMGISTRSSGDCPAPRRSGEGDPPTGQGPRGRSADADHREDERPRGLGRTTSRSTAPSCSRASRSRPRSCAGTSRDRWPPSSSATSARSTSRSSSSSARPTPAATEIGKTGIEQAYDTFLRGEPGVAEARFNASNERTSALEPSEQPKAGHAVRLTIDADLQRAAESAIRSGIELAREGGNWAANGGAIVAMDPRDGAILALASNPTYDPSVFSGRIDPKKYGRLFDPTKARGAELPDAQPRHRRRVPGRLDLQARDGARRARHDPDLVGGVLPVRLPAHHRRPEVRELGSVRERADDAGDRAHTLLRHLLLRRRGDLLRAAEEPPPGRGPAGWASAVRPGSTSARRIRASFRRRPGASAPSRIPWTSSGRAATPCSLRSGRATFSSRRCR